MLNKYKERNNNKRYYYSFWTLYGTYLLTKKAVEKLNTIQDCR